VGSVGLMQKAKNYDSANPDDDELIIMVYGDACEI
jgi:hypothetical protein